MAGIVFAEHHKRKDRSLPGSATRMSGHLNGIGLIG